MVELKVEIDEEKEEIIEVEISFKEVEIGLLEIKSLKELLLSSKGKGVGKTLVGLKISGNNCKLILELEF